MQEQYYLIGEAAGKIYGALSSGKEKTAAELQKEIKVTDAALFNQAIGWLAREDKVNINASGKALKFSLLTCSA